MKEGKGKERRMEGKSRMIGKKEGGKMNEGGMKGEKR